METQMGKYDRIRKIEQDIEENLETITSMFVKGTGDPGLYTAAYKFGVAADRGLTSHNKRSTKK